MRALLVALSIMFAISANALAQDSSITVTLRNSDGSAASGVHVTARRMDASRAQAGIIGDTDDQGRLELPVEPGGIYSINVYRKQQNPFREGSVTLKAGTDYVWAAPTGSKPLVFIYDGLPSTSNLDFLPPLQDRALEAKANCDEVSYFRIVGELERIKDIHRLGFERLSRFIPELRRAALAPLDPEMREGIERMLNGVDTAAARVTAVTAELRRLETLDREALKFGVPRSQDLRPLRRTYIRLQFIYYELGRHETSVNRAEEMLNAILPPPDCPKLFAGEWDSGLGLVRIEQDRGSVRGVFRAYPDLPNLPLPARQFVAQQKSPTQAEGTVIYNQSNMARGVQPDGKIRLELTADRNHIEGEITATQELRGTASTIDRKMRFRRCGPGLPACGLGRRNQRQGQGTRGR